MKLPNLDRLRTVRYPDPILTRICRPVEEFGPDVKALAARMIVLMRQGEGAGLAAPQVGVPIQLFVCSLTGEPGDDLVYVNPRFTDLTGAEEKEEGCLSLPGVTVTMRRATRAVIEALDEDGRPFQKIGEGLAARVWQHEIDHLHGRLITDNMSTTDEISNRRAVQQLEADYASTARRRKRTTRCASSS